MKKNIEEQVVMRQEANELEVDQYQVVVTGKLTNGADKAVVVKNLAELLKISEQKSSALLNRKNVCIKRNLNLELAEKYKRVFYSKGVDVLVEPSGTTGKNTSNANAEKPVNHVKPKTVEEAPQQIPLEISEPQEQDVQAPSRFLTVAKDFVPQNMSFGLHLHLMIAVLGVGLVVLAYIAILGGLLTFSLGRLFNVLFNWGELSQVAVVFGNALPLVLALLLLLLLLRPIFSKGGNKKYACEVNRSSQPNLFRFVEDVADMVEVQVPSRIFLTLDLDVSANLQPDINGWKAGESELYLGLPLFRVLTAQQMAGLIASCLWQFRNKRNMYLIAFLNSVYLRFSASAQGGDGWVTWADRASDVSSGFFSRLLFCCAGALLKASSLLSQAFLFALGACCAGFLKRLQGVADNCQTDLIGSNELSAIFLTQARALHARNDAVRKMTNTPGALRLVNDFAALIESLIDNQSVQTVKALEDNMRLKESAWYDIHLGLRDRIIHAEDRASEGSISTELLLADLLENRESLSCDVSLLYYKSLGLFVNKSELVELSEYAASAEEEMRRQAKLQQYYNGWFNPQFFWLIPSPEKAQTLKPVTKIGLLNDAISRLRRANPDYLRILHDIPVIKEKVRLLSIASEIKKASYGVPAEYFDPSQASLADFSTYYSSVRNEYKMLLQRQQKYSEVMGLRLLLAVSSVEDEEQSALGRKLIDVLRSLSTQISALHKMQMVVSFLPVALARMEEKKETNHQRRIQRITRDIMVQCDNILTSLGHLEWPCSKDYKSTAEFVLAHVKKIPDENSSVLEKVDYYHQVLSGLEAANQLVNGEIAIIAGRSEEALGVEKIKVAFV